MATVTNSIGSAGGRDYSTVALWIAALPSNVVTSGNSYVGECYNDSEFVAGSIGVFSGFTTDATHTITLKCAAGQGFRDNANAQTNALTYNASNGVAMRATASFGISGQSSPQYITLDGLQVKATNGESPIVNWGGNFSPDASVLKNCILEGNINLWIVRGFAYTILNCLVVNVCANAYAAGAGGITFNDHGCYCANNTIVRPSDLTIGGRSAIDFNGSGNTVRIYNNAIFGFSTPLVNPNSQSSPGDYNATDQSSLVFGSNNQVSLTYTSQFQGTTSGAMDFRTKSGAGLIDVGVTDTTDIPGATDIVGTSRPSGAAWDIGCWELVAAPAGKTPYSPWPQAAPLLAS